MPSARFSLLGSPFHPLALVFNTKAALQPIGTIICSSNRQRSLESDSAERPFLPFFCASSASLLPFFCASSPPPHSSFVLTHSSFMSSSLSSFSSRLTLSTVLLLILLLGCNTIPADGAIYLKYDLTAGANWNGDCASSACSTVDSFDCSYDLSGVSVTGNCEIYWLPTAEGALLILKPAVPTSNIPFMVGVSSAPAVANPTLDISIASGTRNVTVWGARTSSDSATQPSLGRLNLNILSSPMTQFKVQDILFKPELSAEAAVYVTITDQGTSTLDGEMLYLDSIGFSPISSSTTSPLPPPSSSGSLATRATPSIVNYPFGRVTFQGNPSLYSPRFLATNITAFWINGGRYEVTEALVASPRLYSLHVNNAQLYGTSLSRPSLFIPPPSPSFIPPSSPPSTLSPTTSSSGSPDSYSWSLYRDSVTSQLDVYITLSYFEGMDERAENGAQNVSLSSATLFNSNITLRGQSLIIGNTEVLGDSHVTFGETSIQAVAINVSMITSKPVSFTSSISFFPQQPGITFSSIELAPNIEVEINYMELVGNSTKAISLLSSSLTSIGADPILRPSANDPSAWALQPTAIDRVKVDWSNLNTLIYKLIPDINSTELTCASSGATGSPPPTAGIPPSGSTSTPSSSSAAATTPNCFSSLPAVIGIFPGGKVIGESSRLTVVEAGGTFGRNESNLNAVYDPPSPIYVFLKDSSRRESVFLMIGNASWVAPPPPGCPFPLVCTGPNATTTGDVNVTSITIPSTIHVIYINGSLTVTGTLTLSGASTTIIVPGCANVSTIEIDLTTVQSSLRNRTVTILTQSGENCASLANTSLTSFDHSNTCQRKSVSLISSNPNEISVLFSFSNDKCGNNTKWIILGAVLGSVVLIAVVGLMLLFTFNNRARTCIRPYSDVRKPVSASNIK